MLRTLLGAFLTREKLIPLYNLFTLIITKLKTHFPFYPMSQSNASDSSSVDSPPPFDPSNPSIPISYPIKTLEELESRAFFKSFHYPFNKSSIPLMGSSYLPQRPRLLVCHDLQGGYGDDKWIQGGRNGDAYAIWHWFLIDVFVYFSHSLVTLPPPCWTNAAHRHGVKVLGTFIAEWEEGRLVCNKLLETKESARMYAEHLAELAVALGFDGWLINMEIKLDAVQIPSLKEFVNHLTQTMHSSVLGSLVIWYDSVTINGDLSWQNQLNDKNKPFFDICDGIFVNYTWKGEYPKLSAAVAGDRKFDVYMGIDVFGRNTFGGGQWNTNVALDVLTKEYVSAAIFAPGWVYETKQPPDFQTAQKSWWALIEKSWRRVNKYPISLPFYSNFDQRMLLGTTSLARVFSLHLNLLMVQVRIQSKSLLILKPKFDADIKLYWYLSHFEFDWLVAVSIFKEDSYNGGGNIKFTGTLEDNGYFTTRLFQGELLLGNLPLHLMYSVKSEGNLLLGLSLLFDSTMNERTSILFASWEMIEFPANFSNVIMAHQVRMPDMAPGWLIYEGSIAMNGHILKEIHAVCYQPPQKHGELRSEYSAEDQDNALANSPKYSAVLGHITIKNSSENSYFPPSDSWLVEGQYIKCSSVSQESETISLKISWKLKDSNNFLFPKYNIYVQKQLKQVDHPEVILKDTLEYLGVAHVEAFYVSDLPIPPDTSSLKFTIQVYGVDGTCQKLDDCPYFLLDFGGK